MASMSDMSTREPGHEASPWPMSRDDRFISINDDMDRHIGTPPGDLPAQAGILETSATTFYNETNHIEG